ncbi:MAG: hypothetical protein B6240_10465 [Desulfobacteraceae bacterium 4572_87]|nr:MAG: hypothetical protein B6240_10465 [Desulfobacteraceae bacterium 4572_87]
MHRLFPCLKALIFVGLCFWFPGCAASPPTHFYLLSPLPGTQPSTGDTQDNRKTTIRVDAVSVPGYLDRNEIVTRVSENEIHLADLNQWGEPLRDNLTCILALNLSRLLPADQFAIFPFKSPSPVDYQIHIEIVQMDGTLDGDVRLVAQWSVLTGKEGKILVSRKSRFKAEKAPADYDGLVGAESRLVEALSREIFESLQQIL